MFVWIIRSILWSFLLTVIGIWYTRVNICCRRSTKPCHLSWGLPVAGATERVRIHWTVTVICPGWLTTDNIVSSPATTAIHRSLGTRWPDSDQVDHVLTTDQCEWHPADHNWPLSINYMQGYVVVICSRLVVQMMSKWRCDWLTHL